MAKRKDADVRRASFSHILLGGGPVGCGGYNEIEYYVGDKYYTGRCAYCSSAIKYDLVNHVTCPFCGYETDGREKERAVFLFESDVNDQNDYLSVSSSSDTAGLVTPDHNFEKTISEEHSKHAAGENAVQEEVAAA